MTSGDVLPPAILQRKAVVYVRQSTQSQIETNTDGRRRQFELVEVARRRGFRTVEVIDEVSADRRAAWSGTLISRSWPLHCAPASSAPSSASMPPGSRATVAIGIACSNAAALSRTG